ncbi:hypothetical protein KBW71_00115 [Hydrogenophaga aromaticivorans]|uniref:hypothetical protein n=1 Tax=Hydrogenophaga aromaticivorans TaxID=2610898 RepID=UPI001B39C06B|nr:hypothetical protein [Hydrogenophaga aromaticivorans]MBQ0916853.1 hypothetical protein [Hydrogenophaga aromaticivorans]
MSAMLQFEGMLMDHQVHQANRNAQEWEVYARGLEEKLEASYEAIAANLGVRYALAEQLRRVDPENPLLVDDPLRNRLIEAAERAYHLAGRHFDAARQVGLSFAIPGRPTGADEAERIAARSAMTKALRSIEPEHPVLVALERADFTVLVEAALKDAAPDHYLVNKNGAANVSVLHALGREAFKDSERKRLQGEVVSPLSDAADLGREWVDRHDNG